MYVDVYRWKLAMQLSTINGLADAGGLLIVLYEQCVLFIFYH